MSMIRVTPTCTLCLREKNVRIRFKWSALTDDGPWAVVAAEGLESFWALRKGEGCLGGIPDTAAIMR